MNQYMVEFELPGDMTKEFFATIPSHRKQVDILMEEGIITNYMLALDRSFLWAVILAESEDAVWEILDTLPLMPYLDAVIFELMFHNKASLNLPAISLN